VVARRSGITRPQFERSTSFGGLVTPLSFTAYPISKDSGTSLHVSVQWGVTGAPHRAAVSFAHLLDGEGRYVAGWDGLTAPATCWQAGDWIEQHYVFPIPQELQPGRYQIEIGWYDADTGQRWPYVVNGETVGDRMLEDWRMGG
jgi:hypothetical protein